MAYTKYSLTPANNTAAPPDGAPEGMLPSAVNDTMRDMMAQIRDAGDGIRDGTYTMTAPKITGGTITGAAFTGNTFTSPVISGGTINNATIGATTATTGKFTTLEATGVATVSAGAVGTPAITTTGDTNTGIFFPAADTIAFAEGGAEAMRIDSSGNVLVGITSARANAGDVQVSKGISFPATQSAQSDANTLDDYEEGTWTPTLTYTGGNGDLSYAVNDGTYIKIGKMVMFTCHLQFGETTASGYIDTINGLPFTSTARAGGGFNIDNMTGLTGGAQWQMLSSATTLIPTVSGTGTAGTISSTNTGAATNVIVLSGVYRT